MSTLILPPLLKLPGALELTPSEGGGAFSRTKSILGAGGLDYSFYDFTQRDRLFQDVAGTTPADEIGEPIALAQSVAGTPAHTAEQSSSSSFRPVVNAAGIKPDGTDDRLLSDWLAQTGDNCIIIQAAVPSSVASTMLFAGATDASGTNVFQIGVNTAGNPVGGFGNQSFTTIVGTGDIRNQETVLCLSVSASLVKLFSQNAEVYSGPRAGNPTTARQMMIGARNVDGVPSNFFNNTIRRIAFAKAAPTLAQYQEIRAEWLAA
jgi:hypothetical protein